MGMKVKKNAMAATVSGEIDDLDTEDKLNLMKKEYKVSLEASPDYDQLKKEMNEYQVELLTNPDVPQLSKINALYAEAQSYSSRVTAIEVTAIDNAGRWKRMVNAMEGYIDDRQSDLLVSPAYEELTIPKATARAKVALKKEHNTLRKLKGKLAEAESFCKMVEIKKKDLASVLTTLGKQVKALSLEHTRG